jgi:tetratricopeptide (TPR) repeat protein
LLSDLENSSDVQDRGTYAGLSALVLSGEGRHEEALAASLECLGRSERLGQGVGADAKIAFGAAADSAFAIGRLDEVEKLLARIDAMAPGRRPPSLRAQAARFRARLAAVRGEDDGVEQGFKTAAGIFREHGLSFHMAVTELEYGEWLFGQGRAAEAEPLLAEAREIFERLEATPWLERAEAAAGAEAVVVG